MQFVRSFLLFIGVIALPAFAQDIYTGAQLGALVGSSGDSNIAYGLQLGANPNGLASFQLDLTLAHPTGGTYFSSSPAIIMYPINYEEFSLGFMAGGGFHKFSSLPTRFALNVGATGDFHLSKLISVGMETRYHWLFSTDDLWNVFLVLRFHFEGDGGW